MPPSAIFYDDTLEPSAIFNGIITWSGLPSPKIPLKFIGGQWKEECIDEVSVRTHAFWIVTDSRFEACDLV